MSESEIRHLRAYPTSIQATGDDNGGRVLTGKLVPYDTASMVLDWLPDGKPDIYHEGFRRGAFGPQVDSNNKGVWHKISLIHKHEGGLGFLGSFIALREEVDGLYGDAKIVRTKTTDVEDLLDMGVNELSVEFRLPTIDSTQVDGNGVRWRVRAHLDQVALEPKGAYSSAQVLQFRAELDQLAKEEQERVETKVLAEQDRRRRFDELANTRLADEIGKQEDYLKRYVMGRNVP